jgi:hypothetical protein
MAQWLGDEDEEATLDPDDQDYLNTIAPMSSAEEEDAPAAPSYEQTHQNINETADEILLADNMQADAANPADMPETPDDPTALYPAREGTSAPGNPHTQYSSLLDQYKKLQDDSQSKYRNLAIIDGITQIGQSLAARNVKDYKPTSNMALFEKLSKQPVEAFESAEKMKLGDIDQMKNPESNVSAFYREMAVKRGFTKEQVDGKSAWDLAQMQKVLGTPTSSTKQFQTKQIYDPNTKSVRTFSFDTASGKVIEELGVAGYAQRPVENKRTGEFENYNAALGQTTGALTGPTPQTEEQAKAKTPVITMEQLPVKKQEQVSKYREQFLNDTKDERASLQASKSLKGLLTAGKALNGDIMRAVQNKFSIATGNKGATSENDVTPFGGRQAILDRVIRKGNFWINGQFTDDDREFLTGLAGIMERSSQNELKQSTKYFTNNLYNDLSADPNVKAMNITPESAEQLLGTNVYNETRVKIKDIKTGEIKTVPAENLEKALATKKYVEVK